MQNHTLPWLLALLMMGLLQSVHADEQKSETTAAAAGMRAYVDPATGKLVSQPVTAEQQRQATASEPAFSQDSSDLRVVQMPDGSTMMDLQGRFQQATVAAKQTDGSLRTYCNDADHLALGKHRHDATSAAVDVQPTPTATPEER
jgi:hypothetical protein